MHAAGLPARRRIGVRNAVVQAEKVVRPRWSLVGDGRMVSERVWLQGQFPQEGTEEAHRHLSGVRRPDAKGTTTRIERDGTEGKGCRFM